MAAAIYACAFFVAAQLRVNKCASASGCCGPHAAAATGRFVDSAAAPAQQGWGALYVTTNRSLPERAQAEAAGFLEGFITQRRAFEFITNVHGNGTTWSPALKAYVEANLAYTFKRVAENPGDPFWRHVGLVFAQQRAGFLGYAAAAPPSEALSEDVYYSATLIGDMDDLCVVFGCKRTQSWRRARANNASGFRADDDTLRHERFVGDGHCSALVKPLGALDAVDDVLFGHTTWSPFEAMFVFPPAIFASHPSPALTAM